MSGVHRMNPADEFDEKFDKGELDDEYADYLVRVSDARIGNGKMLIEAMEKFEQFEEFKEWSLK
jgi:hypothetical protein